MQFGELLDAGGDLGHRQRRRRAAEPPAGGDDVLQEHEPPPGGVMVRGIAGGDPRRGRRQHVEVYDGFLSVEAGARQVVGVRKPEGRLDAHRPGSGRVFGGVLEMQAPRRRRALVQRLGPHRYDLDAGVVPGQRGG
jgi:hypothetical protein